MDTEKERCVNKPASGEVFFGKKTEVNVTYAREAAPTGGGVI